MTTEYPPFHGGGISTYMEHTVAMLVQGGFDVTVFVADGTLKMSRYVAQKRRHVRVVRFNAEQLLSKAKGLPKHLGGQARLCYAYAEIVQGYLRQEGAPYCLEAHDYKGIAYYLLSRKRSADPLLQDLVVAVSLHCPHHVAADINHEPIFSLPVYWTGEMERYCIAACDILFSPSKAMKQRLVHAGQSAAHRAHVVPNPFEPLQFVKEKHAVRKMPRDGLLYVGRLQRGKGIFDLLASMKKLWDKGIRTPLHVIGGDYLNAAEGVSSREKIETTYKNYISKGCLVLHGMVRPEMVRQEMQHYSVAIMPSHFESFSYVVAEIMGAGIWPVVSDCGGQAELVGRDGSCGVVYRQDKSGALEKAIEKSLILSESARRVGAKRALERLHSLTSYRRVLDAKRRLIDAARKAPKRKLYPFIRPEVLHQIVKRADAGRDRLSVVIPYYNMGAYVEETLVSLFGSRYPIHECIIVDDGSDDPASVQRLQQLSERFQFRVLRQDNAGLARARNAGARIATGEFLAFIDPDDCAHPDFFARAVAIMRQYANVHFVGATTQYFGDSQNVWPCWNPEPPYVLFHNTVNSSALMFRREVFLRHAMNDPAMIFGMEDYEAVLRLVSKGFGGVAIPDTMFYYRVRQDSMSRGFNRERVLYLYKLIAQKHAPFFQAYADELVCLLNANGPGYKVDNPTFASRGQ